MVKCDLSLEYEQLPHNYNVCLNRHFRKVFTFYPLRFTVDYAENDGKLLIANKKKNYDIDSQN